MVDISEVLVEFIILLFESKKKLCLAYKFLDELILYLRNILLHMKDPLLVQIFIRGAKDEDIIFNLPLQKQVKLGHELYFITIDRLGKVLTIHEYISCTMKDITLSIKLN